MARKPSKSNLRVAEFLPNGADVDPESLRALQMLQLNVEDLPEVVAEAINLQRRGEPSIKDVSEFVNRGVLNPRILSLVVEVAESGLATQYRYPKSFEAREDADPMQTLQAFAGQLAILRAQESSELDLP